ncbi:aminoacyl-tRNA hydrolase [Bacillus haynesii]|uniref:aminoacyl-tRNA hydrolase n=1 Tax=Bacillus haynesii TaxID=1925021 RepID=UPI002DBF83ED|nr:aminoacyl-tRNA hydrolase [Bacillus haynesii]MEC1474921.1 aminoacyl-tRNA hydrolase [Bacillus haynesii]MEC1487173.1 aminoacyl-tRNA hydrolase [Bacillus haynesii]
MLVFAGLGNPGKTYENTRHNVGFMTIDELSKEWNIPLDKTKFNGQYGIGFVSGKKVLLVKPLTYMNLSGECLRPLLDYYEIPVDNLKVIYDDLDLPTGRIRLRTKGSAGGHNGIKSMIQHLGTTEFNRIRIGIGRPVSGMKIVDYVLGAFTDEEEPAIQEAVRQSAKACEASLEKPFLEVMNEFNAKV